MLNLWDGNINAVKNDTEILLKSSKDTELLAYSLSCPFSGIAISKLTNTNTEAQLFGYIFLMSENKQYIDN